MADRVFHEGEVIDGRYRLTTPLGKGAFGVVWKAIDQHSDDEVAIKVLLDKYRQDKKMLGRFVQEAKILEKLEHPNISKPVTWDAEGQDIYLTMEFIDGETLDQKFAGNSKDNSPIPAQGIAWICDRLCSAVSHAHSQNIIHRDLKPKNVMVNRRGQRPFVKVLDFGIAKMLVGSEIDPTTVGRVLGSVLYISPEQVLGRPLDHRVDIFALGTILFELIALRRAWARDGEGQPLAFHKSVATFAKHNSHVAVLRRIAREGRPSACAVRSDLSPKVDEVLHKAMSIKAEERYDSADEFAAQLRAALTEPQTTSAPNNDPEEAPTITMGGPPQLDQITLPGDAQRGPGLPKFGASPSGKTTERGAAVSPFVSSVSSSEPDSDTTKVTDSNPSEPMVSASSSEPQTDPKTPEPGDTLTKAQPSTPATISPGILGVMLVAVLLVAAASIYFLGS